MSTTVRLTDDQQKVLIQARGLYASRNGRSMSLGQAVEYFAQFYLALSGDDQ